MLQLMLHVAAVSISSLCLRTYPFMVNFVRSFQSYIQSDAHVWRSKLTQTLKLQVPVCFKYDHNKLTGVKSSFYTSESGLFLAGSIIKTTSVQSPSE